MKRIAIIGAGKGGYALLNLLLDVKSIKVVGIADKNKNAPALKLANHHNIFTAIDYNELLKIKNIDILINLTGSDTVSKDIQKRALKAELIEGMSAKLVWDILDKLKEEQEEIVLKLFRNTRASFRQLSRLTNLNYDYVRRICGCKGHLAKK